jgi:hypothetical protein
MAVARTPVGWSHRTNRAGVPYCAACSRHVRWHRGGGWPGLVLSLIANSLYGWLGGVALSALLTLAIQDPNAEPRPGLMVAGCVLVGVALALAQGRFWRPRRPTPEHAAGREPVEIVTSSASSIVLRCQNDLFAEELLRANPDASDSPAAWSLALPTGTARGEE